MNIYSVKMRSAKEKDHKKGGIHISGAEKIVKEEDIKNLCNELIDRAFNHSKGKGDFINISINKINEEDIKYIKPLNIKDFAIKNHNNCKKIATEILLNLNIEKEKCEKLLEILASIENMTGAMIIDINTLQRLDEDTLRGIRVTNMDFKEEIKEELNFMLKENNFFGKYLSDAITLSSKVCSYKNIICELCFSDDPNYTTGYISTKNNYNRLPYFKSKNHKGGGRIFVVDGKNCDLNDLTYYLQEEIVLIEKIPKYEKVNCIYNSIK